MTATEILSTEKLAAYPKMNRSRMGMAISMATVRLSRISSLNSLMISAFTVHLLIGESSERPYAGKPTPV